MTPIGIIIILLSVLAGIPIGLFIFKRFPNLFNKFTKEGGINKVLKNPHLLIEKLKSHGKIYDMGKRLEIKVGQDSKTGQDVVVVEERESKKAEKIQEKITGKKGPKITSLREIKKRKKLKSLVKKKKKKEKKR